MTHLFAEPFPLILLTVIRSCAMASMLVRHRPNAVDNTLYKADALKSDPLPINSSSPSARILSSARTSFLQVRSRSWSSYSLDDVDCK